MKIARRWPVWIAISSATVLAAAAGGFHLYMRFDHNAQGEMYNLDGSVDYFYAVELFLLPDGTILVNELAPRPHNSGHFSLDAAMTNQFEQQLRAVCGLPLGSTELLRPCAMANLLGDAWEGGEPDWAAALGLPSVRLHLYGKKEARPGRKMGHLVAMGATLEAAEALVRDAQARLTRRGA